MKLKRSGFSLVLSLTVMSGMVLMVIVLASFLQIESRLAQGQAGYQRARLNALAAARVAIGQLQYMMGPDQRVSMRADMYADDVNPGPVSVPTVRTASGLKFPNPNIASTVPGSPVAVHHQRRYWTGVWATGGIDSTRVRDWSVTNPHNSRLFLGWLVSPTRASAVYPDEIEAVAAQDSLASPTNISIQNYSANRLYFDGSGNAVMQEGQALINALAFPLSPASGALATVNGSVVPLVSRGSVSWPAAANAQRLLQEYYGAVDATPLPLPGPYRDAASRATSAPSGRFAFWIGDEGLKAKVNLPDSYAHSSTGQPRDGLTDWDRGFSGAATMRNGIESVTPSAATPSALDSKLGLAGLPANFGPLFTGWRASDIAAATGPDLGRLARVTTPSGLLLWAKIAGSGEPAGAAMDAAQHALWHDITVWSYSTLTDTYNGGFKTDLSTAFELPYSVYRTLELFPGQKASAVTVQRAPSLFHGAQGPADLDFNRPNLLDTIGSADDLLKASPRASEWAARYVGPSKFGALLGAIRTRNGGETPERLGFTYEVPIHSNFFNDIRLTANNQNPSFPNLLPTSSGAPTDVRARNTVLPWSNLYPAHPDNLMGRIVRGPTWDLYRNWYRMYKRETEAAAENSQGLRGIGNPAADSFLARGLEPFTFASGLRYTPGRRSDPPSTDGSRTTQMPVVDGYFSSGAAIPDSSYRYRNNFADGGSYALFQAERRYRIPFDGIIGTINPTATAGGGRFTFGSASGTDTRWDSSPGLGRPTSHPLANTDGWDVYPSIPMTPGNIANTTRTWPTSPQLSPTILRLSTVYSGVRNGSQIGVTIDPIVVVHNPYDAPMEFEGLTLVTSGLSSPFRFIMRATGRNYNSTNRQYYDPVNRPTAPDPVVGALDPMSNQTIDFGDVVVGGGENDNRPMAFRIVAGSGGTGPSGARIRLEPGEVRVLATSRSAGALVESGGRNVSIPGDVGFVDTTSRVFYKMTPFHNVRSRLGSGSRNSNAERVLWNLDFEVCKIFAEYNNSNYQPPAVGPWITWTNGGLADIEYARRLNDLWNACINQRKIHDAFPTWDGTVESIEAILGGAPIYMLIRNSGWVNYNGYIVGAEAEQVTRGPPPTYLPETYTITNPSRYVAAVKRNGRVALHGNQSWNFYLQGKRSINGLAQLNTHRRWFGAPNDDPSSYIPDPANPSRLIRKYAEGTETVNGFGLVDEPLLLNFQAMTAGWPMYPNSNNDSAYYYKPNLEWTRAAPFNQNPATPDYHIKAGYSTNASLQMDPEFNGANNNAFEATANKADTLSNHMDIRIEYGEDGRPVLMIDFVRRAADTTRDDSNVWYPRTTFTAGFGNKNSNPGGNPYRDRMKTPDEIRNAPMTPYFIGDRAQQAQLFGYDGKAHTPMGWIETQRVFPSEADYNSYNNLSFSASGEQGYWGRSLFGSAGGSSNVVLHPLPRRPMLSLVQLGSAPAAEISTDADITVGASYAHPGIADLTRIFEWPGPREAFTSENGLLAADKGPVPEHGYVAKAMGTKPVRNRTAPRVDHAFAANFTLWDSYYFSGLNLAANSYNPTTASNWPTGPDLPSDSAVVASQAQALQRQGVSDPSSFALLKAALEAGRSPLANKRVAFIPDGKQSFTTQASFANLSALPETEFPHPKYIARNALYDGGFNINSTSKPAWKAVLSGLRGQPLADASGAPGSGTALTRFARAFGPGDTTGSDPWNKHRELSDQEIDALATAVVREIRGRGPFMSLADFVNRRLINADNFGLRGALQAAIDKSGINATAVTAAGGTFVAPVAPSPGANWYDPNVIRADDSAASSTSWWRETSAYPKIPSNTRFPAIRAMSQTSPTPSASTVTAGLGAAGIVTQADVLNSIGPSLTARSDTFTVRAYGEALDNSGKTIGKAWIEVVVQRTNDFVAMSTGTRFPEYTELSRRRIDYRAGGADYDKQAVMDLYEVTPDPAPPGATAAERQALAEERRINRVFGRRFRAVALRWLGPNDI
ncbi:MAG: hypothetical protein ACO3ND_01340 [Opitutales bacterium]